MPDIRLRGGFRYMTTFLLANDTTTILNITNVSLELAFQPPWPNLKANQGYLHSDDELVNRIWYAGAYTVQTDFVPTNTGRQLPFPTTGWANNGTLGPGDTTIVDGAKRNRAVWPGDMGVAVPSAFVSLGDLESMKNALQVMYDTQVKIPHRTWLQWLSWSLGPYYRCIRRVRSSTQSKRLRHVPHVEDNRHLQLRALPERYILSDTELAQESLGHGPRQLARDLRKRSVQRHRHPRLGPLSARLQQ